MFDASVVNNLGTGSLPAAPEPVPRVPFKKYHRVGTVQFRESRSIPFASCGFAGLFTHQSHQSVEAVDLLVDDLALTPCRKCFKETSGTLNFRILDSLEL